MSIKHNMSLSLETELQEKVKRYARSKNISVSRLLRDLIEKYIVVDEDVIPVILKIPAAYKTDKDGLSQWLEARSAAIVKALHP